MAVVVLAVALAAVVVVASLVVVDIVAVLLTGVGDVVSRPTKCVVVFEGASVRFQDL